MASGTYSIGGYLEMITDGVRMQAYHEALRRAVKPGCVVADIGTGTGIFAVLACLLGARRVYAIEPGAAIDVARRVAADNGVADRIEFLPEMSTNISLPESVDVVVSDVRGILPWYQRSIPTLIDARERFLADGGTLIPSRDHVWAAIAEDRKPYGDDTTAVNGPALHVDMSAGARFARNTWRKANLTREQLRTEPQEWATLDYTTLSDTRAGGQLLWTVEAAGTANGVCIWFSTDVLNGVGFSNAPGEPKTIYGQAFFPFEHTVELALGDQVTVDIDGALVADDYAWRWTCRVTAANGATKAAFEQSTIRSAPVSLSRLRRREAGHLAALSEDGKIDRFVLSSMDGATPLSEIARRLDDEFPGAFANDKDALQRVARLSERYSR